MASLSIVRRFHAVLPALTLAVSTILLAATAGPAAAQGPTGFTLDVSPNARVLDALDMKNDGVISSDMFYEIKYDESCDNPHLRIRARNKPAIMITNTSANPLTSMTLNINSGTAIFGMGDVGDTNPYSGFICNTIYTDPGVIITSNTTSNANKTLTVNFDGLTQGKIAIFNVDLDETNANAFMYPDYRMVLFGAPLQGQSTTTPASVSVTFDGLPSPPPVSFIPVTNTYGNPIDYSDTPDFANENIRAYAEEDKMEVNHLGGAVPEPTAAVLTLAGLAFLAAQTRRSREAV